MPGPGDTIRKLYFGRDDAEHDLADGLLREGFLSTAAYEAVLSGRKILVIGRKGVGKSAICMRLSLDGVGGGRSGSTVLITPDDAAGDEIRRFELQGLTPDTAKSLIWRYVFAVHAARHVITHARARHGRRLPASVRALRKFLRANGEEGEARLYDRLVSGTRGLQTALSLEAFGVKASLDVSGSSEGARATAQLDVLETGVARALSALDCAETHGPLLVLVDQLEQVWSNDPDSKAMVTGLLLAGKHVAGAYGKALRCVLFLRADIYDSLEFSDGDKYRGDEIRVEWTPDELKELALTRASVSLGRRLASAELWGQVFPERTEGLPTAEYLFSRSLPRPRDTIQYLNLCRDKATERGHTTIGADDIALATRQFSEWKLQDVAREYLVNYPFLSRIFALFQNTGYVVMRPALASRFEEHREALHTRFPDYTDTLTVDGVIDVLFGVNFLGVRRGSEVVHTGGARIPVEPHDTEFHIHPCFRPALNALNSTELRPYNPLQRAHAFGGDSLPPATVAQGSVINADFVVGRRRDFTLAQSLIDSCERIRRQLGRADLPAEAAYEISVQVGRVVDDASHLLDQLRYGNGQDVVSHLVGATNYLNTLAVQLVENGVDGGEDVRSVVRRIQDETRRLGREIGGGSNSA
ncbi:P-loop ATPase, Sll1717 family [Streptomyces sp. NPDC091292]|uniref:P-loop ATPase, Sll1717 family n=1 Tax=Streptomyces sp. NPDC091292 TaxID=3365991 RepID=UPI0038111621